MNKRQEILVLILIALILSAISLLVEVYGRPPVLDPSPRSLRLLWFWAPLVTFYRFRFLTAAVLFLLSTVPLVISSCRLSGKNLWFLGFLSALDIIYIGVYCRYGYAFFGFGVTNAILVISFAWLFAIWVLLKRGLKSPSFWNNVMYKASLVLWITSYAFPFFGAGSW